MLTIGLTGGIASGKTLAARYFAELGITVIDADIIARDVVVAGTAAHEKIIQHFGTRVLDKNGGLLREKLREVIFVDANEREWLEQLLHPLILQEIKQRIKQAHSLYCIVVIPLLLEKNTNEGIDRILVIDAPETLQIQRLKQRDNLTEDLIKAILRTQLTRQQRLPKADDVIINDGEVTQLKQEVNKLHNKYLNLA